MACLCSECHTKLHFGGLRYEMTLKAYRILNIRYGYRYPKDVILWVLDGLKRVKRLRKRWRLV